MNPSLDEIGPRIRKIRRDRGYTLRQVGEQTGLSTSLLSMVERSTTNPSIGTLVAVADMLRVPVATFFEDSPDELHEPQSPIIPAHTQPRLVSDTGLTQRIFAGAFEQGFEFTENRYEPGGSSSSHPIRHAGFEVGLVLEGQLEVTIDDETYLLHAGDVIQFDSTRSHYFHNPGPSESTTHWVNVVDGPQQDPRTTPQGSDGSLFRTASGQRSYRYHLAAPRPPRR